MMRTQTITPALFALLPLIAAAQPINTSALDAHQFNLGTVGLVGHISAAEQAMNEIAQRPEASTIFLSIIQDGSRGAVAKLYALCGLKKIQSPHLADAARQVSALKTRVSTMTNDVMTKEDIQNIVQRIQAHQCAN